MLLLVFLMEHDLEYLLEHLLENELVFLLVCDSVIWKGQMLGFLLGCWLGHELVIVLEH